MTEYPRTYPLALWLRALVVLMGLVFSVPALLAVVWLAWRGMDVEQLPLVALGVLTVGGLGIFLIASALRTRVVLTPEGIGVQWAIRARHMATADIEGRRVIAVQYGQKVTVLSAREGHGRDLKIPTGLRTDAAWDAWLQALPDLDALQARELEAEVAANPELGQTPEERLRRLAAAKKLAVALNVASYAVLLWALLYPQPYDLLLLAAAALPWLAIVLAAKSHGLCRLYVQRGDVRPNFSMALLLPGVALLLRALKDVDVLDLQRSMIFAALTAAVLTWAVVMVNGGTGTRRTLALVLFGIFGCTYGYGAVVLANSEFDRAPGELYRVEVLMRHVTRGSKSTTYHLLLDRWGPRLLPEEVQVPGELYARAEPGTLVCVHRGPGALGISWFRVSLCES